MSNDVFWIGAVIALLIGAVLAGVSLRAGDDAVGAQQNLLCIHRTGGANLYAVRTQTNVIICVEAK